MDYNLLTTVGGGLLAADGLRCESYGVVSGEGDVGTIHSGTAIVIASPRIELIEESV